MILRLRNQGDDPEIENVALTLRLSVNDVKEDYVKRVVVTSRSSLVWWEHDFSDPCDNEIDIQVFAGIIADRGNY